MMTLSELKAALEELEEAGYGDFEVRLATQPTYPLQSSIRAVAAMNIESYGDEPSDDEPERVVYIAEGEQVHSNPYAPGWAFNENYQIF